MGVAVGATVGGVFVDAVVGELRLLVVSVERRLLHNNHVKFTQFTQINERSELFTGVHLIYTLVVSTISLVRLII